MGVFREPLLSMSPRLGSHLGLSHHLGGVWILSAPWIHTFCTVLHYSITAAPHGHWEWMVVDQGSFPDPFHQRGKGEAFQAERTACAKALPYRREVTIDNE